jgi:hypothetical protein
VITLGFFHELGLHLLYFLGLFLGEIVIKTEIVSDVIKLPDVAGQRRQTRRLPRRTMDRPREPAVLV